MRISTLILVLGFILSYFNLSAQFTDEQQKQIDSLKLVVNSKTNHDTILARAYMDLADNLYRISIDSMLIYSLECKSITENALNQNQSEKTKRKLKQLLAESYNNLGFYFGQKGNYSKAIEEYEKSKNLFKELDNQEFYGYVINHLSNVYFSIGNTKKAIELRKENLSIQLKKGSLRGLDVAYSSIGEVYDLQGNPDIALKYFKKSVELLTKEPNLDTDLKIGLSFTYRDIAEIYASENDYKTATNYIHKALKISKELNFKPGNYSCYQTLGTYAYKQAHYDTAIEYYNKAEIINKELNIIFNEAQLLRNYANVFSKIGNYERAEQNYKKAMEINRAIDCKDCLVIDLISLIDFYIEDVKNYSEAKKYIVEAHNLAIEQGIPYKISKSAHNYYRIAQHEGDYKKALEMRNLQIEMQDSLHSEEVKKTITRLEAQNEYEQERIKEENEAKEKARILDEQTQRRDNLQYSLIFLGILLLFGVLLSFGHIKVNENIAEGLIFFSFLILFEFILVFTEPYIQRFTNSVPIYNLLANSVIALLIFPLHDKLENSLKKKIVKK